MKKVPVTEEEKRSPYYKYFLRDLAPISPAAMEMLKRNPLTPETALKPDEVNRLFEPGHLPGEFGWTRLKNVACGCSSARRNASPAMPAPC